MHRIATIGSLCVALLAASSCAKAPQVPHAIESRSDASCLGCHRDGTNGARKTPHSDKADCLRCHE